MKSAVRGASKQQLHGFIQEVSSTSDSTIHTERFSEGYVGHREPQLVQHRPGEYGSFPAQDASQSQCARLVFLSCSPTTFRPGGAALKARGPGKSCPTSPKALMSALPTPAAITWMSIRFDSIDDALVTAGTHKTLLAGSCIRQARDTPAQWPNDLFRDGPTPYAGSRTRPTHARCWGSRE